MNYEQLKLNFENHGFNTSYFDTKEEAADYLTDRLKDRTIGFGGSMTLKEMGLYTRLSKYNSVYWHWEEPGADTLKKAREAEIYLTSANGVSEGGELINIDGTGNRISMTIYGPKQLYVIIGVNKLAPNIHAALHRAKNVAAPKNALRLKCSTPCVINGGDHCYDCNSPERICKATVIMDRPCNGMKTEVVFINEDLGY